jgi:ferredoxin
MAKKVVIDRECCVGCGTCQELCPEVFRLDESNCYQTGRRGS